MRVFKYHIARLIPSILLSLSIVILNSSQQPAYGQQGYVDMQVFYDELSPYGQWFNDPQYGYVWSPNVGRDFRPYYTNGYWVMTQYGNMWMSNYSWGWAPFHYGRWTYNDYYGWLWIPGNEWGPAWVSWRQGGGYYGWAPLSPGISINVSFGSGYYTPHNWWTFIPFGNIYSRSFHRYYSPRRTVNIINNTTIINNTYYDNSHRQTYVTGPRRNEVERYVGKRVPYYTVNERNSAGRTTTSGRNLNVYRPRIEQNTANNRGNSRTVAPRNVTKLDKPIITSDRATNTPQGSNSRVNSSTVTPRNSNTPQESRINIQERQNTNVQPRTNTNVQPRTNTNIKQNNNTTAPVNNRTTAPTNNRSITPRNNSNVTPTNNRNQQNNIRSTPTPASQPSSRVQERSAPATNSSRSSTQMRSSTPPPRQNTTIRSSSRSEAPVRKAAPVERANTPRNSNR